MNATQEEALENAGTRTLSRPGNDTNLVSHILNVDEVREYEEEVHLIGPRVEGEHRAYDGPYTDMEDPRNSWTAAQEAGEVSRTRELMEDPEPATTQEPGRETREQREQREKREQEKREQEKREQEKREQEKRNR